MSARLFVALDLPDDALAALPVPADPPWRALARADLHVTLAFLGWVEGDRVGEVAATVEPALRPVGKLRLGAAIALPPRRPRVLAVELADPEGAAMALQASVAGALAAAGLYEPERREWLPHVTVGRARGPLRPRDVSLPEVEPLELVPPSVSVYRSHLGRGGARYEALSTFALR